MPQEFDEHGRGYWNCPGLDAQGGSENGVNPKETREAASKEDANLISSLCSDGMHRPVIDIDVPVRYVPSSTDGHGHLYVDVPMTWEQYQGMLAALSDVGLVQEGYVRAALARGATFVRPPWVKKPAA
jgi:hypothetical protein